MSCLDYRNEPDFPGCCDSCHDDDEQWGDALLGDPLTDEENVCCQVRTWLLKRKDAGNYSLQLRP